MTPIQQFQQDLLTVLGLQGRAITKLTLTLEVDKVPQISVVYDAWGTGLSGMPSIEKYNLRLVEDRT